MTSSPSSLVEEFYKIVMVDHREDELLVQVPKSVARRVLKSLENNKKDKSDTIKRVTEYCRNRCTTPRTGEPGDAWCTIPGCPMAKLVNQAMQE